jgi:UDPglucose 6-dehydrogenase
MKMTVIGTGYLGAVHAACMADMGHDVLGVDIDEARIATLAAGRAPFFEPGLEEILQRALASGRLGFSTSLEDAAAFGDVHFICVGTPQLPGSHAADLKYVNAAVDGLIPFLDRPCVVVGKSTVPVGTAERLAERISKLAPAGNQAELVWNPEFLREGFAVEDTLRPDRLVLGVRTELAEAVMREVYGSILRTGTPCVVTDFATAELVKVAANAFLATKISFINAMAEVCEAAGADVVTLSKAIGYDGRIGSRFLNAGLGFGGGCLPKDIRAFKARAGELGADEALSFLSEVDKINMRRRERAVEMAQQLVGGSFIGANVVVLGCAFKPLSDDVRDSPALNVAAGMQLRGAQVSVHDPVAIPNARKIFPTLNYQVDIDVACAGADLVLLATEWDDYKQLDPVRIAGLVRKPILLDGRNALDTAAWEAAGWHVTALGRASARR